MRGSVWNFQSGNFLKLKAQVKGKDTCTAKEDVKLIWNINQHLMFHVKTCFDLVGIGDRAEI